nr:hypothetical protein GCM10020063_030440 [Dactylosporangium thailandense]
MGGAAACGGVRERWPVGAVGSGGADGEPETGGEQDDGGDKAEDTQAGMAKTRMQAPYGVRCEPTT